MTALARRRREFFGARTLALGAGLMLAAGSIARAQSANAPAPAAHAPEQPAGADDKSGSGDKPGQPGATERDARKLLRERAEQIIKMLDEGKTLEDIRARFPEMSRLGPRGEGRGGRRWEDGSPGPGGDGEHAPGNGQPPHAQVADAAHPLTPEDRAIVREILEVTGPAKLLENLRALEKTNPTEAEQKYAEALRRSGYLLDLRKRDEPLYQLRLKEIRYGRQAGEAARAIVDLDSPPKPGSQPKSSQEVASARGEKFETLKEALKEQYEVRTQIMQHDWERLKATLDTRTVQETTAVGKNAQDAIDHEKRHREKQAENDRHPDNAGGPGDHKPATPPPGKS